MKDYRFNKEQHIHQLLVDGEWKNLTGITTILQVVAKPALIQWAANMAVDYIESLVRTRSDGERYVLVDVPEFKEARTAHRKKKEEAGQKGTDVHALIEQEIKNAIENTHGFLSKKWKEQYDSEQILHFFDWALDNKVKFLDSEKHIYSKEYFLGGVCDFVCEIDNEVWLGDIKTGSGIYPEHFWQTAGYQLLFEEMGVYQNIKGHIVLNLKKDGSFDEKRSISNEDNRKAFLACLTIYRIQEKLKNNII